MAATLAGIAERWKALGSDPKALPDSSPNWLTSCNGQRVMSPVPVVDPQKCPPRLLESLRNAFRGREWPIYLTGETGTGKTSAAACVFRSAMAKDCHEAETDQQWPRWIAWPEFCGRLNAARIDGILVVNEDGRRYEADERGWWRRWSTRRVVVVDEIGIKTATQNALEAMWQLLEIRRGLPTIFTGNLDEAGIRRTFDDRVLSRLLAGTWIEVRGKDRRVSGAADRRVIIDGE